MSTAARYRNVLIGAAIGICAIVADNIFAGRRLAIAQMCLWTILVFAIAAVNMSGTMRRPRLLCLALVLAMLHLVGLAAFARYFPLNNFLIGFAGAYIESLLMVILYARLGQVIDPGGFFGLTDTELRKRRAG